MGKDKKTVDVKVPSELLEEVDRRKEELNLTRSKLVMRLIDGFSLWQEAVEKGEEERDMVVPAKRGEEPERERVMLHLSPTQREQLEELGGYTNGVGYIFHLYSMGALDPYLAPQLRTGKYEEYKKGLEKIKELMEDVGRGDELPPPGEVPPPPDE